MHATPSMSPMRLSTLGRSCYGRDGNAADHVFPSGVGSGPDDTVQQREVELVRGDQRLLAVDEATLRLGHEQLDDDIPAARDLHGGAAEGVAMVDVRLERVDRTVDGDLAEH